MTIFNYLKYYGNYTFAEKEFNEVDNLILSLLSYVDYNGIVSEGKKEKITLNDASEKYFQMHDKKDNKDNVMAVREGIKLLKNIKDVKRFKDILLYNYKYIGSESSQFSAITFDVYENVCYVAFEGTDHLISGWKEDCKMAYEFPVEAHSYAIKYLNKNFLLSSKKLIVGGHSKGGNLALVSSMYCNFFIKRKILKVYSNDGQGLRSAQINSRNYKNIEDKYIQIIPQDSVVGLLLRHKNKQIVTKSNIRGILAHNPATWQVEDDHFKREKLSKFSLILDEGVITWLDKYNEEEIKKFVDSIFKVLEENNVLTLLQLVKERDLIFKILKSSKDIDPIVKEMLMDLVSVINEISSRKVKVD